MKKVLRTSAKYSFTVLYEPIKEGGYQVTVPLLPGIISYGRDFHEAQAMARDAICCHIEALKKEREEIPNEQSVIHEQFTVTV